MIAGAYLSEFTKSHVWYFAGAAVLLLGLIIGFVMRKVGYGVGGSKLKNSGH